MWLTRGILQRGEDDRGIFAFRALP